MKMCNQKLFLVVNVATMCVTAYFGLSLLNSVEPEKAPAAEPESPINPACPLPDFDAFDQTILRFLKTPAAIDCSNTSNLPLTFVDDQGFLNINQTAINASKLDPKNVQCFHQEIIRTAKSDSKTTLGPEKNFSTRFDNWEEFTLVTCKDVAADEKLIHQAGYTKIIEVPNVVAKRSQELHRSGRASVFMIVLDSMSRLNFIRQLPKSYEFIQAQMNAVVMKGLTKVGTNTLPNLVAILTGLAMRRDENTDNSLAPFWEAPNSRQRYFDHLPLVWKNFSADGYVTMYGEDYPQISGFNYMAKGFKNPPTDYYMRPFWKMMEERDKKIEEMASSDRRCYGLVPKHKYLLKYMDDFGKKMQDGGHAFFAFTMFTLLCHDRINDVKVMDDDLLAFLESQQASGAFENTAFVILGDHGNRFDAIRSTVIGRIEERMPFLSISLPDSLEHFRSNLEENANKLTSWHDLYETLMDMAMNNTQEMSQKVRFGHKGLSLFRPVPTNRTCLQIGIPPENCVCWSETELRPKRRRALKFGRALVEQINKRIQNLDKQKLCAVLKFDSVKSAQELVPSESVADPSLLTTVRVAVLVKPSGALLEGVLEQKVDATELTLVGNLNRLNVYGNQSECVTEPQLKLSCLCKK